MFAARFFAGVSLGVGLLATIGCGGNGSGCAITGVNVVPSTATADHAAPAPGNSQTFTASFQLPNNSDCAVPAVLEPFNWTASDPSVHLSTSPTVMVTATCTAALANPVTITATPTNGQMLTGKGSLTCN
jgi:hypothetical protein